MSLRAPIQGLTTKLGVEQSSTPVAGANDTVVGATIRKYSFFTLPGTSSDLYVITGIEWLNGTVVNGNVFAGVDEVLANPPTLTPSNLKAWTAGGIAQSGVSAVQRVGPSGLTSTVIVGGTILGGWIASNSASGRFGTTTVASANKQKNVAGTATLVDTTAWTGTTEEAYVKVYYKRVF